MSTDYVAYQKPKHHEKTQNICNLYVGGHLDDDILQAKPKGDREQSANNYGKNDRQQSKGFGL